MIWLVDATAFDILLGGIIGVFLLAVVAEAVTRKETIPRLAYVLWLLVLARSVLPPMLMLSIPILPSQALVDAATPAVSVTAASAPSPHRHHRAEPDGPAILPNSMVPRQSAVNVRSKSTTHAGVEQNVAQTAPTVDVWKPAEVPTQRPFSTIQILRTRPHISYRIGDYRLGRIP